MPWRRLASSAAGERMNSSSARAASGCVDAAQTPPENVVTISQARRHRADHVDAVDMHQLAELLEAQLDFAAREQRAHRHARRRLHEARRDRSAMPQRSNSFCSATPLGPVE